MTKNNYYEILGVNKNASFDQIKRAYYTLSKKYHPDINPKTANLFRNINEAYQTLSNPEKRKEYDFALANPDSDLNDSFINENMYYDNPEYYQDPNKEPIVNILDDFWKYRFENAISAIWKRSIFVLLGNSLLVLFITLCTSIEKIFRLFNKTSIPNKRSKIPVINYIYDSIEECTLFKYICQSILLITLTISKTVFLIVYSSYWIFSRILRYFLIPAAIVFAAILHIHLPKRKYY